MKINETPKKLSEQQVSKSKPLEKKCKDFQKLLNIDQRKTSTKKHWKNKFAPTFLENYKLLELFEKKNEKGDNISQFFCGLTTNIWFPLMML